MLAWEHDLLLLFFGVTAALFLSKVGENTVPHD